YSQNAGRMARSARMQSSCSSNGVIRASGAQLAQRILATKMLFLLTAACELLEFTLSRQHFCCRGRRTTGGHDAGDQASERRFQIRWQLENVGGQKKNAVAKTG